MALIKITDLSELATSDVAQNDFLEIVDSSATSSKKAAVSSLISPSSASKTADFTFSAAEANRTTVVDSSSAVLATIPTNASVAYPIGTRLRSYRKGTGSVKITPDSGVTLRLPTGIVPRRRMNVLCTLTADKTAQNYSAGVRLEWDDEIHDTDAFHDTVTNPSRITIPSNLGIKKVAVSCSIITNNNANYSDIALYKDGAVFAGGSRVIYPVSSSNGFSGLAHVSVPVVDATYLEINFQTADTSIGFLKNSSHFSVEVTEIDAQGWIAYRYGAVEIEKIGADEWIVIDQSALG